MLELTEQMYNAVLTLDDDYRQFFCLKHCQEHGVLYLLKENAPEGMPLMFEDQPDEGDDSATPHIFLPVWCHPRFVEYYMENAPDEYQGKYEMVELPLSVFKKDWAPSLKKNNIALALLPLQQEKNFNFCAADIFENENAADAAARAAAELDKLTDEDTK